MPDIHPGALFIILVTAVPLQFYLSPKTTSDVKFYLQRLTDSTFDWAKSVGIRLPGQAERFGEKTDEVGEISDEDRNNGYFGTSSAVRDRAPHLIFSIGDVVKHKMNNWRGVIIGWDLKAAAPEQYLKRVYKDHPEWIEMPNYAVLVDGRDRLTPQLAYVPQDLLELNSGRINHFLVKSNMERYDPKTEKYIPKPWLQKIFPDG